MYVCVHVCVCRCVCGMQCSPKEFFLRILGGRGRCGRVGADCTTLGPGLNQSLYILQQSK